MSVFEHTTPEERAAFWGQWTAWYRGLYGAKLRLTYMGVVA